MASRTKHHSRPDRDSDSMEALKPLVVLVLFGTILYGAYSVVQKGPSSTAEDTAAQAGDAAAFQPPAVEPTTVAPAAAPAPAAPLAVSAPPASAPPLTSTGPLPPAAAPAPLSTAVSAPAVPAAVVPAAPQAAAMGEPPAAAIPPPPVMPAQPPAVAPLQTAALAAAAAGAGAAIGAAVDEPAKMSPAAPTYLTAESAPPPMQDSLGAATPAPANAADGIDRPDRYATLSTSPPPAATALPQSTLAPTPSSAASGSSAPFATAWTDAHDKLAAGRYAEALAALSVWYDDPSLGLEESQRLEDLLGQLAGTVIYSQQDLLLPPHVVAAGETLPAIAGPLGVSWQLLGKINGIADPQRLVPGEHVKVVRGPFDAVVSVSRRRLSLQLGGNYAGSFPVVVGRQFLGRMGSSIPVVDVRRGAVQAVAATMPEPSAAKASILLGDGLVIEAVEDPGVVSDTSPATSLVVSVRDLEELLDLLGPGARVLVRQ